MKDNKNLTKGIQFSGIAMTVIILAPILITMGFKGIKLEDTFVGWLLLSLGVIAAISGMLLLVKGIKILLDFLFEK